MSVFEEPGRGWVYEFRYRGQRYRERRGFRLKDTAEKAERKLRDDLERAAAGLAPLPGPTSTGSSPRIAEFAGVYMAWVQRQASLGNIKRPERIADNLRVALRFWGARPATAPKKEDPHAKYHDLRLDDPIRDPAWLRHWDEWLDTRGSANHTRNHYNSAMSRLYWLALQLEYRRETGIALNPFAGRPRARGRKRHAILEPAQVSALMAHASYHVGLALSIAALAHKLRLANVLALQWSQVNFDRHEITVREHKTDQDMPALIVPMTPLLEQVLKLARKRALASTHIRPKALDDDEPSEVERYVITYRGKAIGRIHQGLEAAARPPAFRTAARPMRA